jgi:PPK2 family polyphosphate:nucleotide phosphotransferase
MDGYRIKPGQEIKLEDWDPADTQAFEGNKKDAKSKKKDLRKKLIKLQETLYAEHEEKLLIVLQGMDTSGKDGTIRHVFKGVNPQGVRVSSFKVPTQEELDHDYLWRIHKHVPAKGEIVIFNRSHYEDVLVVRVHELVKEKVGKRRYQQINQFEKMLHEEGVTILKFFLHIDLEEQKKRLQARIDTPDKQWKFNSADLKERKLWDDYIQAYQDVLNKTSQNWAPWYLVPANNKWYRNLVISSVMVDTLEKLDLHYPPAEAGLEDIVIE